MLSTIMFYVYVILWIYSLGEGCTHVAGLLFALEGRPVTEDDVPWTSKPCEWNRPSKRKKDTKPVQDMSFKEIKLSVENVKKKKTVNYNVDSIKFRNSLCAKLWNHSRAAIFFYILPPCADNNINVQCDLNIAHFAEVETSDHILHLSVKDISRKLYILWEKELIEARRAENSSFSHRMYSLRLLSYLKHYFLCVNIG